MNKAANLSPDKRRDLFSETSARMAINPAIVEKDFWVCWVLKQLFTDPVFQNRLVFKGGTSLSKVYNQIERFYQRNSYFRPEAARGCGRIQATVLSISMG